MHDETSILPKTETPLLPRLLMLLVPLLLVIAILALLWGTGGGLRLAADSGRESLVIEQALVRVGSMDLVLRNNSLEPLTVIQASINDALWPIAVQPEPIIEPYGRARLNLNFEWLEGQPYRFVIYTARANTFTFEIPAATVIPRPIDAILATLSLLGLYAGLIPVFLGLIWLPALASFGRMGRRIVLVISSMMLLFLAVRLLNQAANFTLHAVGAWGGWGSFVVGLAISFFLLRLLIAQQTQPLAVLYLAALGFGLFNLGYATALGLAYTMAQLTLTAMLVGSLILATMGQGWALAALSLPISLDRRPLLLLGFVAGFPALLGAWLGGLPATPTQTVLLLGIGLGGLLAAGYEVAQAFGRDSRLSAAAG